MKKTLAIISLLSGMLLVAPFINALPVMVASPATSNTIPTTYNVSNIDVISVIRSKLKEVLPELKVDSINQTAIQQVYEVISGRKVFYVNSTGQYAILGNLVDLNTKRSLTQQKVESLSVVDWNKLPLTSAIRHVIGKGERRIAVFTDPECPFCKELDQNTIPKLKNVTVYYFLFPLPIHKNAEADSQKILCSENPEKTYLAWMVSGQELPVKTMCQQAKTLIEIKRIGTSIGIDATPTIILPNGVTVDGLVPADYLNKLIDNAAPVVPAKANT